MYIKSKSKCIFISNIYIFVFFTSAINDREKAGKLSIKINLNINRQRLSAIDIDPKILHQDNKSDNGVTLLTNV